MKIVKSKEESAVLRAARRYTRRGWRVVPIPAKEKGPRLKGWQNLRLDESELADYFPSGCNIGLLLGEPSGGLVDVDLDCEQAVFLGPLLLPFTGRVHGHKSKLNSHWGYKATPIPAPKKFTDLDGTCIVELRSTGEQTIVPPSIHPSGEKIKWARTEHPARVNGDELYAIVQKIAAAALIARHWPAEGSRNEAALALAGTLLRAGWDMLEAGEFVSEVARAAGDEEWLVRNAVAVPTWKRLDEGAPATGRPHLAELIGEKVVDKVCEWLGIGQLPVRPQPAGDSTWPKALTNEAFCGLPGDIIRAIEPETEADPAAMLVQLLLGYGSAIGRRAHITIGPARHYANLFCAVVGETAMSRKGTSWTEVSSPLQAAAPDWWGKCVLPGGLSSGEGLIWQVRDADIKRGDLGGADKRLLVFETEFASPLRVMKRPGNTLSTVIRSAFDTGDLANLPKKSSARATGAHVSIVAHTTLDDLRNDLTTTEGYNGFANRFLWVCATRTRTLPFGGNLPESVFRTHVERLREAIVFGSQAGHVGFGKEAKAIWEREYPRLLTDVPGLLGAVTSRGPTLILRLALIYALMNSSPIIKTRHLKAALEIWRYCEDSCRYLFGRALGHSVADRILGELRKHPEGLTRTEISAVFANNINAAKLSVALDFLSKQGRAFARSEASGERGRPAERWFAGKEEKEERKKTLV